jgi:LuxR family maltose regulon positive regulatory protein
MADELPLLHRRAAAGESDMLRKIGFLVGAGDWSEAEAMLGEAGETILATAGVAPVMRLIERFPADARRSSPLLLHIRTYAAWSRWDWPTMLETAAAARAAFARAGDARCAWRSGVYEAIALVTAGRHDEALQRLAVDPEIPVTRDDLALAGTVHSYIAFDSGRLDEVADRYREMLELLEPSRNPVLWYQCVPRSLQCALPSMHELSRRFAAGALAVAPETPTPLRAIALAASAWSDVWAVGSTPRSRPPHSPRPTRAGSGRRRTCALRSTACSPCCSRCSAARATARARSTRSSSTSATPTAATGATRRSTPSIASSRSASPTGTATASASCVWPPSSTGWRLPTRRCCGRFGRRSASRSPAGSPGTAAMECGTRRLRRRARERNVRSPCSGEANRPPGPLALASLRLGAVDDAAAAIAPAFAEAEASGVAGAFLACGKTNLEGARRGAWHGALSVAAHRSAARWATGLGWRAADHERRRSGRSAAVDVRRSSASRESLSARELEVLRLIAAGDSNKLIATRVRSQPAHRQAHVANILDKLGVQSRGPGGGLVQRAAHRVGPPRAGVAMAVGGRAVAPSADARSATLRKTVGTAARCRNDLPEPP